MSVLGFIFAAQLLVMLSGLILFLVTPADFHSLAALIYLIVIGIATSLFAAWRFVASPAQRRLASAVIVTPWLCLGTPFTIVRLNGGPINPLVLVAVGVALLAIIILLTLWRPARWRPGGVFANSRFNLGLGAALCILLALYWAPIVSGLYTQESLSLPRDIAERDRVLLTGMVYFSTVAGPACLLSLFTLFYAPVGLLRNAGRRLIHGGQFLLALLTLASLALGAFVVAVAMMNPG